MALDSISGRLKASTSGKSSKRILLLGGAVIVGALAYVFFTPAEQRAPTSQVAAGPQGGQTVQGREQTTPYYNENLSMADRNRLDEARDQGGSAIPTVRPAPAEQATPVMIEDPKAAPPVVERPVLPVIEQMPVVAQQQAAVPIVAPAPVMQDPQASQAVQQYMLGLARRPLVPAEVYYLNKGEVADNTPAQSSPASVGSSAASSAPASKVKLPLPGTILYAELIGRANSDSPGPVLAKLLQGPYAGSRLIGSFQATRDALVIQFDKMAVSNDADGNEINETVAIEAVAVDVKNVGTAMASSVDRHLAAKIGFGFLQSFAQGFGSAVGESDSTTTVRTDGSVTSTGSNLKLKDELLAAGGQAVGNTGGILFQEFGNRPTTIIVDAGTPIGVLLLSSGAK